MDYSKLAQQIYNECLSLAMTPAIIEGVLDRELPKYAAQILGAKGGSVTGGLKAETSRANGSAPVKPGSRRRGRPTKA